MEAAQDNQEKHLEAVMRVLLGSIAGRLESSRFEKAKESILNGIEILESLEHKSFVAHSYRFLGELYADNGENEKALQALRKAEQMGEEMGMMYWLDKTRDALANRGYPFRCGDHYRLWARHG
jgi:tetratricopeptide (TPR) repeat protein